MLFCNQTLSTVYMMMNKYYLLVIFCSPISYKRTLEDYLQIYKHLYYNVSTN